LWFEACFNFRDLGGYPTVNGHSLRWRTLYRSDTLHRLTAADAEAFAGLGLRTVIDLRSATEIEDYGRLRSDAGMAVWHHAPMLDNLRLRPSDDDQASSQAQADALPPAEHYFQIIESFSASVARSFKLLATDGALPAVFHCTGGRDRTGMVAALMLDVVGVPDEIIADDYLLTRHAAARTMAWVQVHEPEFAALVSQIPPESRQLRADTILDFLEMVRSKYGSAAAFLLSIGVTEADQASFYERLITQEGL
jgi:protein tyrosine/serine phosphatase